MIKTSDKKKKCYILMILSIAILAILVLPNLIVSSINELTKETAKRLDANQATEIETIAVKTINQNDGSIEVRQYHLTGIAYVPGQAIYCVEHGARFHAGTLPIATAQKYGYLNSSAEISWGSKHATCWPCEHDGEDTYPYLKCVGNHYDVVQRGSEYHPEAGYILTYPDMQDVTMLKQMALWATELNFGRPEAGNSLYQEAMHYKEFHDQTTEYGQYYDEPDIKVTDETEKEKVTIKSNYKEQTLTVGPFSIDYINGVYEDVAVGGISDMYLIGYNQENEVVKERIDIIKYIDPDGVGNEPEYFEPNETDKSFVDYTKQVYPKGKSAGEETFQVQIENPNADLAADADQSEYVTKLKLHIEFKWMGVTAARLCEMEGWYYTVSWRTTHSTHYHGVRPNRYRCYYCYGYSKLLSTPLQDHVNLLKGERKLFKTELEIDVDGNGFPMTMDLGGKVWEDVPEGKESLADGIYKEGTDRVLPNVKVTIYDEEGTLVNLRPSSEEVSDAQIMSKVNPTYTDEKGDYLFKGLDPLRKYYITFEYNGQVYLPTDYQKDDSQYNRVDWYWTSKGTEKSTDRNSYDETYSEIGSAPANYLVPDGAMQIAPLTNGYNEAFSQYDLMGFKMTESGDYIQETRLIDSFYKIEGGNIVETNENQEGEISRAVKEWIIDNRKAPTEDEMLDIYQNIAGRDEEMLRKLQFIEDTKIESYTKAMDIISSSGSNRPNPGEESSGGSNNGSTIITVNRDRLLREVKNAMKQIRIDYEYKTDRDNTVWSNQATQTFTNINQTVSIPNQVDFDVETEVTGKFLNILKNMIQREIVNNYIPNYERYMYDSRYQLNTYLSNFIQNNYQVAWEQAGMEGENELNNLTFRVTGNYDINSEITGRRLNPATGRYETYIMYWQIPNAVANAMRNVRIYYDYQIEREHIWEGKASHYFNDINQNVSIQRNIDEYHRTQAMEKFFAMLKNRLQEDLRTDYVQDYQLNRSKYDLINYITNHVRTYYKLVWAEWTNVSTTYLDEIVSFDFKIVDRNTGREIQPEEIEFDDIVAVNSSNLRTVNTNNNTRNTNRANTNSDSNEGGYDLYPIYDEFVINKTIDMTYDTAEEARSLEYDLTEETIDDVVYKPIYPGQFYINQGLWRRQEVDLALRKDVLYAATRINGKTEVYEYNKRDLLTDAQKAELRELRLYYEQNGRRPSDYQAYLNKKAEFEEANLNGPNGGYWQIQLRMRDYNNYYEGIHTKELYEADYNYRQSNTNGSGKDLELYVTYKITVRNASQSIVGQITELVDYYDRDYTYRDDLSWVMYKNSSSSNDLNEISFTEAEYYDTIHEGALRGSIKNNNKGTDSATTGTYERSRSTECRSDMVGYQGLQALYIKGLENKQLASGEEAYVYLTFQVKSDGNGPVIVDNDNSLKENYVEINGYKTYYENGTSLPNGVTKGRRDVAGLIDINSTPGNLCREDLRGNRYEKNFENDTDRAKSVKVTVEEDFIRSINGTVWEDERNHTVQNTSAIIGDGIRKDGELGVNGVTVELVEKLEDGGEFLWQTTQSGTGKGRRVNLLTGQAEDYTYEVKNRGYYEFSESITGNYIIRFHYGDKTLTVQTESNGGSNATSYNGQDFKSTLYQTGIAQNGTTDRLGKYVGYTDTKGQNATGTYGYDIHAADSNSNHVSDAKDIWSYRQKAIEYSNNKVTNHIAEVLAAPYTNNAKNEEMIQELIDKTQMIAETGVIVLEGEYNRTGTDGYASASNGSNGYLNGNDFNGKYTLNNVDFGLAERPKAQLEIGKKITNIQIKLANGNILFDANDKMTDLTWVRNQAYELSKVGILNENNNNKYQQFYELTKNRYTYRTEKGSKQYSVNGLVASKYQNNGNNGLIVATMDEELMQGANIAISYLLTVTNVGETDYVGQDFYYLGTGANTVVTTRADVVTDYVANNLNFNANAKNNNEDSTTNEQNGWKITDNVLTTLGLNNNLATKVSQYNDVIHTENLHEDLVPVTSKSNQHQTSTSVGLVLTQLINPENSTDDKTYDNVAEITTISNSVGRRMAYSIQGNQDPTADASKEGNFEVDAVKSERVTILPPFGSENIVVYIAIAASVLVILAGGIILIKKKVLKK